MSTKTLTAKVIQRHDTAANWSLANPVLLAGEIGVESDTQYAKLGNGTTTWNSLTYMKSPYLDAAVSSASSSASSASSSATSAADSASSAHTYATNAADSATAAAASSALNSLVASCYDEATSTWEELMVANVTITATGEDLTISQITDFPFNILARSTTYTVGTIIITSLLPKDYYLICTTAGTTATTAPNYTSPTAWATITDGTAVMTVGKFLTEEPALVANTITNANVGNSASKIPVYSSDGHLVLPSGLEIW